MSRTRARWREAKACLGCGNKYGEPEEGKHYCTRCRLKMNENARSSVSRARKDALVKGWITAGLCCDCGGKHGPLVTERRCDHCRQRDLRRDKAKACEAQKRLRERRFTVGLCKDCGKVAPGNGLKTCRTCADRRNVFQPAMRIRRRDEVFAAYGGYKCICCGEEERDFLTIDHANGDGWEHRKTVKATNLYHWLKQNKFPPGFQVLCYNCNCGSGKANMKGICPHKRREAMAPEYII